LRIAEAPLPKPLFVLRILSGVNPAALEIIMTLGCSDFEVRVILISLAKRGLTKSQTEFGEAKRTC